MRRYILGPWILLATIFFLVITALEFFVKYMEN